MALPALGGLIASIAGSSAAATALSVGGSILSSRSQRKAQQRQNQYNDEAYDKQVLAEIERDRLNREGVFSGYLRPYEESILTRQQAGGLLGGVTPEARDMGDQILALHDKLQNTTTDEEAVAIQDQINELQAQKRELEYSVFADKSAQFDPMREQALDTARGIHGGGLLDERLASMRGYQDIRAQFDPLRQQYLPGIEAAQDVIVDPAQMDEMRRLNIQRAEDRDSPEMRALRLETAGDRTIYDPLQESRRALAESNVAGIKESALRQAQAASAGRTYGGSSTVQNRVLADLSIRGNQRASMERLSADQQNMRENQQLLERMYQAQGMNIADETSSQQILNDARIQNEQQRVAGQREANVNTLNQIQNRQNIGMQGLGDRMATAQEIDRANLASQQLRLSNIGLPEQLYSQSIGGLMAPETQMQNLMMQRMRPWQVSNLGAGRIEGTAVPVPQASVNDTWGTILGGIGGYGMQNIAQTQGFQNQQNLMNQQFQNNRNLQNDYLDRRYGPSGGLWGQGPSPGGTTAGFNQFGQGVSNAPGYEQPIFQSM